VAALRGVVVLVETALLLRQGQRCWDVFLLLADEGLYRFEKVIFPEAATATFVFGCTCGLAHAAVRIVDALRELGCDVEIITLERLIAMTVHTLIRENELLGSSLDQERSANWGVTFGFSPR